MKKILILSILFQYVFSSSSAQNIDIIWHKSFSGHEAYSIHETFDDGFILTGKTYFHKDILKLNSNGDSLWSSINFQGNLFDLIPIEDDGYIVAGSDDDDDKGIVILKLDDKMTQVWKKNYQKTRNDFAFSIIPNTDNGFLVGGISWSLGGGDYWILNLNEYGDTLWTKTFSSPDHDVLYSINKTSDDKYIIAGSKGYETIWILKLDENGDTLWTREYKGSVKEIIETSDGGFIFTGRLNSKILVSKLDKNGFVEWSNNIVNNEHVAWGNSIIQTSDNGYLITGTSSYYKGECVSCFYGKLCLVKLDSNGNILWHKELEDYFEGKKIQKTLDDKNIVLGINNYLTSSLEVFKFKELITSNNLIDSNSNYLLVSPIPAKNYIRIKNKCIINDETQITIYNISGRKVLYKKIARNQIIDETINLTDLIRGTYFLKIESNDINKTEKILIE